LCAKRFVQNIPYQLVVAQATPNSLGTTRKITHCTVHVWDDDIIVTWTVSGPKEVCECTNCNWLQSDIHPVAMHVCTCPHPEGARLPQVHYKSRERLRRRNAAVAVGADFALSRGLGLDRTSKEDPTRRTVDRGVQHRLHQSPPHLLSHHHDRMGMCGIASPRHEMRSGVEETECEVSGKLDADTLGRGSRGCGASVSTAGRLVVVGAGRGIESRYVSIVQ
jgi:hypothetical protein